MERYFADSKTIQRFRSGPLGPYVQQLADQLSQQRFTRPTVRLQLRAADHFGRWLRRRKPVEQLMPDDVKLYMDRRGCVKRGDAKALRRLVEILDREGLTVLKRIPEKNEKDRVADEFAEYLRRERSLATSTIECRRLHLQRFLAHVFRDDRVDLSKIKAEQIVAFVRKEAARMHAMSAKNVTSTLRSFLAYTRFSGLIDKDLIGAVPTVSNWSLSGIPKGLSRDQVNRVLAACNRQTPIGRRDYSVLLLLARLGLRGGEVARLNLDDINWEEAKLSVRGKGGTVSDLPLPADVGAAIAAYLRRDRPAVPTRRVFLRVPAPPVGLKYSGSVGLIVKHALERASVDSPRKGAHVFRHSLATEMLRGGASLTEIGDVLRHQNSKTTAIYAKVDFGSLRPLAQAWPGGVR